MHGGTGDCDLSLGCLAGAELQGAVDEAVADAVAETEELTRAGIDIADAHSVRFEVREGPGIDPGTILLSIAVGTASKLSADALKALWTSVLARVRNKHGDDAVGPPQDRGST